MRQLTPRQTQILEMIQEFIAETGMPPTRAEIASELGFRSANAAEEHLRALQKKGVLELVPGASRGIQLKDSLREQMGLPLIGRVAAGSPILAQEHIARPRYAAARSSWRVSTTKSRSSVIVRKVRVSGCCPRTKTSSPSRSISPSRPW